MWEAQAGASHCEAPGMRLPHVPVGMQGLCLPW